jgi:hypothetical protein
MPFAIISAKAFASASGRTNVGERGVASIRITKFWFHTPSRLGAPNVVRGAVYVFCPAGDGVCAKAVGASTRQQATIQVIAAFAVISASFNVDR